MVDIEALVDWEHQGDRSGAADVEFERQRCHNSRGERLHQLRQDKGAGSEGALTCRPSDACYQPKPTICKTLAERQCTPRQHPGDLSLQCCGVAPTPFQRHQLNVKEIPRLHLSACQLVLPTYLVSLFRRRLERPGWRGSHNWLSVPSRPALPESTVLAVMLLRQTRDRGQRTEDRRQKTEDRGQKTEDRGQKTDDRTQELCVTSGCAAVVAAGRAAPGGDGGDGGDNVTKRSTGWGKLDAACHLKGTSILGAADVRGGGLQGRHHAGG